MKQFHDKMPCLSVLAITFWSTFIIAQEPNRPPPLKPFENVDKPTEQVVSVEDLLSFLPDLLATYGEESTVIKAQLLAEMGAGLKIALQQGRKFNETEIRSVVHRLVDAYINLAGMLDLAQRDGYTPNLQTAEDELTTLRTQIGEAKFKEMLLMQDLSVESLSKRISQRIAIETWINQLKESITVTPDEIRSEFESARTATDRKDTAADDTLDEKTRSRIENSLRQKKLNALLKSKHESWKHENNVKILF